MKKTASKTMKKTTSKSAAKKPAQKTPTKKPPSKPKRKAQGASELAGLIDRLGGITEQLARTAERLTGLGLQPSREEEDAPATAQIAERFTQAPAGSGLPPSDFRTADDGTPEESSEMAHEAEEEI